MTTTDILTGTGARISVPGVYGEVLDFLVDEAHLLDTRRELEWLERVAEDVHYYMPIRQTRYRADGDEFMDKGSHYDDDWDALRLRVKRNVEIQNAYDRDPETRVRRLVTNLILHQGESPDEYRATSSILVLRSR